MFHRKLLSVVGNTVLLVELIDTATNLASLLSSGIERMALGANFDVDAFLGRSGYEGVTTVAGNGCLIVIRLNIFAHDFHLFLYKK